MAREHQEASCGKTLAVFDGGFPLRSVVCPGPGKPATMLTVFGKKPLIAASNEQRALEERVGGKLGEIVGRPLHGRQRQYDLTLVNEVESFRHDLAADQGGSRDQLVDAVAVEIDQRHPHAA